MVTCISKYSKFHDGHHLALFNAKPIYGYDAFKAINRYACSSTHLHTISWQQAAMIELSCPFVGSTVAISGVQKHEAKAGQPGEITSLTGHSWNPCQIFMLGMESADMIGA
jgi:hypothetical protein